MIDIWKYKDAKNITLTDMDGSVFKGEIIEIIDIGEKTEIEEQEDSIVLNVNGTEIEFLQSEIAKIVPD